jgi:hypothetical protein
MHPLVKTASPLSSIIKLLSLPALIVNLVNTPIILVRQPVLLAVKVPSTMWLV